MSKRSKDGLLAAVLVAFVLGACPAASAESERADCPRCRRHVDGHCRAGCPQTVAWYATPSNTRHYGGYYVGGGKPLLGESRSLDEGTWGWDFFGYMQRCSEHQVRCQRDDQLDVDAGETAYNLFGF
jgi:hypothetical protein